tara:strand:+ start:346 stop:570 length:225 start_codon:yes stop_codon:yes gene_type:complete
MGAKDKAKELVSKFTFYQLPEDKRILIDNPKQCALICVDEILRTEPTNKIHTFKTDLQISKEYWQEVKEEIKEL